MTEKFFLFHLRFYNFALNLQSCEFIQLAKIRKLNKFTFFKIESSDEYFLLQGDVIGVAQIVNKQNGIMFTKSDIEVYLFTLDWI